MNKNKKKIRASVLLRIALLFLCALLMAAACTFAVCYKYVMNSVETGAGEIAEAAATSVMTAIGSREGLDALYKDEALRDEVHKTFRFICRRDELRYLYLYTVDAEEVRHYVISAASSAVSAALCGISGALSSTLGEAISMSSSGAPPAIQATTESVRR